MPPDTPREERRGAACAGEKPILVPGHSCWRTEHADRAAFLIDAAAYYSALADALEQAQRRVMVLGWDFHSRVALRREGEHGDSSEFAPMLDRLVRRRRDLHVHLLEWDFAVLYLPERESLRTYRFGTRTHRRVHFRFDAEHPVGASHHQKLVVVDDALAFAGGIDITSNRWDTRAHAAREPRRVDPDGRTYAPFHDAQMAVDGAAAAALGELARVRWQRATGQKLQPVCGAHDPWPERLGADVADVDVGIARTDPGDDDHQPTREVFALYRESIAAARHWIYLENQYLTAGHIAECLAARLQEPEGPEVVIVVPERCSGWLEESSMGVLRDHFVKQLRDADAHDRLRVLHPRVPGLGAGGHLNVHAKLMIVDDRLARIGSANLSNRSMGLDTECDLAIEAQRPEHARAIAGLRNGLLGEHLGVAAERVAETLAREDSLIGTIERLSVGERRLDPVEITSTGWSRELAKSLRVFDPESPLRIEELLPLLGATTPESGGPPRRIHAFVLLGLSLLALAAWRLTPLAELVEPSALADLGARIRGSALGPPLASLVIGLATLVFVPVTALIVACGLVFSPWTAFAVALGGSSLGAAVGYALGRGLWRDAVRRLAGARFHRISRRLGRRGILATAAVRLVPIAPFGLVNLVAGASHVGLRDFVFGTTLAMAPGIAALVLAADRVTEAVATPGAASIAGALAVLAGAAGLLVLLRRAGSGAKRDADG